MIEIIDIKNENIFGLRIDGKFNEQDVKKIFEALAEKVKDKNKFKLYYEISDFDLSSISKEMIEDEFKYLYKNPAIIANMEKVALISDVEWLKKVAAVEFAVIPTLTGKTFSFSEKDEAMKWLRKDQRAESQIDIIFPELAELGTIKALGGFGLGMLAANYLSRKERKNLGLFTLAGSFILGIPFAIKVLNNNRRLLGE